MNAYTIAQQLEADQAAAPQKYRELISPGRESQPDDIETLRTLMQHLGITPAQVSADIAALQRVASLTHSEDEKAALFKASNEARAVLEAYDRETQELIKQREEGRKPLNSAATRASLAVQQLTTDGVEFRRLRHNHRLAFGLPPRPETPKVSGPVQTIQERGVVPPPSYKQGEEPKPPVPGQHEIRTLTTYPPGGNPRIVGHIPAGAQVADADVGAGSIEKPASDADVAASLGLV